MAEHIDYTEHRDGGDDYLKPNRFMRQGNGGSVVSESAVRHVRQFTPPHRPVPYTIDRPEPPRYWSAITTRLCWLAVGMALTFTLILAAGRG